MKNILIPCDDHMFEQAKKRVRDANNGKLMTPDGRVCDKGKNCCQQGEGHCGGCGKIFPFPPKQ